MFSRAFLLAASLALVAALDLASALPLNSRANIDNSGAYLVELPLDHFGDGQGTFKNRFWVYDLAYKPGGPIIIEDAGEVNALLSPDLLRVGIGASVANSTNGLLVRWEHRFYGESMPEFTNKTGLFEPDNLADYFHYHTVDQALEDVVAFSSMLTYDGQELSPSTTPWVFVGGSYSGARAAWLRERNPEIIFASLASSAVVEITEELPQYREAIFSYFDTTGRKGCMDDVRSLIKNMNDIYTRKNYAAYKKLVTMYAPEGPANRAWNDAWAQYYFSIIVQEIFGTGFEFQSGNTQTTDSVCKKILAAAGIELGSEDIKEISVDGIDATPGYTKATRIIMGALESHNSPTKPTFSKRGLSPANENSCGTTGNQEDCMVAITENSWYYQVCSQMGYFQNTDSENDYLVFENLKGDLDQCVKTFGQSVAKGPSLNPQKYGGKDLNLSNTFWADGQYDPWRAATPNSFNSGRVPSQNIPEAGKTLEGNQFFGIVVNDTFHTPLHACVGIVLAGTKDLDMAATNLVTATNLDCKPGVFEAQQLFLDAIVSWLPSFKGINNTATLTTEAGKATAVARGTA